jgi:putative lipoprotein
MRSLARIAASLGTMSILACGGSERGRAEKVSAFELRGTVSYRERMALPPGAIVEVWILDVSPMPETVPLVAETKIHATGRQVPLEFTLPYDPSRVDVARDYGVKAAIRDGDRVWFESPEPVRVLTKGHPAEVALLLQRVPESESRTPGEDGPLLATSWRLTDLAGSPVLERVTLEFPEEGKVAGRSFCNQYFGSVEVAPPAIRIHGLGSTRMACAEPLMAHEQRFFDALQAAVRLSREGTTMLLHCRGIERPLRFTRE